MERTLKLVFSDDMKNGKTISFPYPRLTYTDAQISKAMDLFISTEILPVKDGVITTKQKAYLQTVEKTPYDTKANY